MPQWFLTILVFAQSYNYGGPFKLFIHLEEEHKMTRLIGRQRTSQNSDAVYLESGNFQVCFTVYLRRECRFTGICYSVLVTSGSSFPKNV